MQKSLPTHAVSGEDEKSNRSIQSTISVTPPPSGAASSSTWAERDAVPQVKDYIIDLHDALNAPGYIAGVWAHYKTIRGAPFPHIMSQN